MISCDACPTSNSIDNAFNSDKAICSHLLKFQIENVTIIKWPTHEFEYLENIKYRSPIRTQGKLM
jgi:hypothetical protein